MRHGHLGGSGHSPRVAAYKCDLYDLTVSEEAYKLYRAAPSFSYWDPEVLNTFIRYGITKDKRNPPSGVKLKGPVLLVRLPSLTRIAGIILTPR